MSKERNPIHTELAELVDPGGLIAPEEYQEDALYRGIGGDVGRVAIFKGETTAGRLAFQGYQILTYRDGWTQANNHLFPVLKTEAYLPIETARTAFRPTQLITEVTPSLSGDILLDWYITKDLEQAEIRLATLLGLSKDLRKTPFIRDEITDVKELIRVIKSLRV